MSPADRGERAVLVLNAGSSSIKFCTFRDGAECLRRDLHGQVSGLGTTPKFVLRRGSETLLQQSPGESTITHAKALEHLLDAVQREMGDARLAGVGHRVVHGGLEYMAPVRVDTAVLDRLDRYVPLAPLHQPHNLAAIRAVLSRLPDVPQVACFDTAFHHTLPELERLFALPPRFAEAGIRRYGFHGLSYEYIASQLPALDAKAADGRVVVFHLGNGASMCGLHGCRSAATSMGFTAVDGLPMGTRCGSLDPGVVLFMMDEMKLGPRQIEQLIYNESGLLGVSGVSNDMRTLLASDAPGAKVAVELFAFRAARELGALAAAIGGLDAVVFTAGIGENQPEVRAKICRRAAWLGVDLDEAANDRHGPRITRADSRVAAYVVPTDEESMIARHVESVLAQPAAS